MLKYSKRTMCKALHEKILHILIAGRLLKDAYVVVKVFNNYLFIYIKILNFCFVYHLFSYAEKVVSLQDNAELISRPAIRKFAFEFMKSGNVNLINDVMKAIHGSGYKIDQVKIDINKMLEFN